MIERGLPTITLDRTAGSHSLAVADQRIVRPTKWRSDGCGVSTRSALPSPYRGVEVAGI